MAGGAIAGSCRNCGGVVGSAATAGTTRNCRIWPVRVRIGDVEVVRRLTAAKRLVGADVAQDVVAHRHAW